MTGQPPLVQLVIPTISGGRCEKGTWAMPAYNINNNITSFKFQYKITKINIKTVENTLIIWFSSYFKVSSRKASRQMEYANTTEQSKIKFKTNK